MNIFSNLNNPEEDFCCICYLELAEKFGFYRRDTAKDFPMNIKKIIAVAVVGASIPAFSAHFPEYSVLFLTVLRVLANVLFPAVLVLSQ